jgi:hypothetical protein
MMKALILCGAALIAAPLLAKTPVKHLEGVSDKETTIPYRDVRQSVKGHGDVFYVRDRSNQWYRLQLNDGCARGTSDAHGLVFRHRGSSSQIDRFTTVIITHGEGRSCAITSIRSSKPPKAVDSKSRVTMD